MNNKLNFIVFLLMISLPPGAFFAYLRGIFFEKADYIEIR